jgi:hypothetical protein
LSFFINYYNDEVSLKTPYFNGREQVEKLFTKLPNPFFKNGKLLSTPYGNIPFPKT